MILFLLTKCINFENNKFSYWYFKVVSVYLKKLQINTSICHCFVFYFSQISLSDRVLYSCPTTHVFALCRIYRVLFYFICYLFLHIYLNANIGSFMEEWWPHKFYVYMNLLILTRFDLKGCKKWFTYICRLRPIPGTVQIALDICMFLLFLTYIFLV